MHDSPDLLPMVGVVVQVVWLMVLVVATSYLFFKGIFFLYLISFELRKK